MNKGLSSFNTSSEMKLGLKLLVIFLIIMLLLIPLALIKEIAVERKSRAQQTEEEIINMNGGRPALIGPVLIIPVTVMVKDENNHLVETKKHIAIQSDKLDIHGDLTSEIRSRGIYKVPLFSGTINLSSDFSSAREKVEMVLSGEPYSVDWNNAWYALELMDKRSLKSTPMLSLNGKETIAMKGSESSLGLGVSSVRAKTQITGTKDHLSISLSLGGGGTLLVYPFGQTVSCTITSDWKAPSFSGYVVPSNYSISANGFNAAWFIPDSAQPYPDAFIVEDTQTDFNSASFGVDFFQPISIYHKTERALKYGLLFVIVPFIVFFLFEIFFKKRIHPLQYTLIGIADILFYLILLSFSEHLPFINAYALGAMAVCLLVAFYSGPVLGSWKRGLVMIPVLGGIYLYLYIALESEDYALIIGTAGVFALLATFMILTRKIDWYALSLPDKKSVGHKPDDDE